MNSIVEKFSVRDLAELIRISNCQMHWSYGSGGYYVSLTDVQSGTNVVSASGDILAALNSCFEKIEKIKEGRRDGNTIPAPK